MSKINMKRNEHIVPKAHLKRFFNSENKINVLRYTGEKFTTSNLDDFCSAVNYYDTGDPYALDSVESELANIEKELQPVIDRVIESGLDPDDKNNVRKYVKNLYRRSPLSRLSAIELHEELGISHEKDAHRIHIKTGECVDSFSDAEWNCEIATAEDDEEFITADNAVVFMNLEWEIFPKRSRLDSKKEEKIYLCPMSPEKCILIHHKNSIYFQELYVGGNFNSSNINRLISNWAMEILFYKSKLTDDAADHFINSKNPTINKIRSKHLKYIRGLNGKP